MKYPSPAGHRKQRRFFRQKDTWGVPRAAHKNEQGAAGRKPQKYERYFVAHISLNHDSCVNKNKNVEWNNTRKVKHSNSFIKAETGKMEAGHLSS